MIRSISFVLLIGAVAAAFGCSRVRFIVDAVPAADDLTETTVMSDGGSSKIALIDMTGLIVDAETPGLLVPGENPVATFVESLNKARGDNKVKAVIVRLNSPGGTVTASDVAYREVQHFRETSGKPVVMLMSDVAASGAYYLACAGDRIIAHPTTVTGSIGVIMQTINFSEGMRKIGIRAEAFTSGPNKDMGSPFEPMEDEHRALLQGLVNEFYGNFMAIVQENRPELADSDLAWATDGRVISGAKAAEVGLVDATGDLYDAFAAAKELAGLADGRLVKYHRPLYHVGSAYAAAPSGAPGASQINVLQLNLPNLPGAGAGFWYLWDPSVEW